MRVGQAKAIEVLQLIYEASGRRTAGVVMQADGSAILPSVIEGSFQPIMVIARDGTVRAARATIGFDRVNFVMTVTDIVF